MDKEHASAAAPVVSVLMTLHNKAAHVEEAMASVLASTFADLELLVVDDGSTDDGVQRARAFTDPRIRVLPSAVNTGRAAAANRGFDAARGEFVAILDADDRMRPDRLAKQVEHLRAHPETGACGSAARIIGRGAHVAAWPADDRWCRARLVFEDPMLYGSAMFRRSVLERHGIRCAADWRTPGMDYLFQVALAPHTRFANLPEPLTEYRIHSGNMRAGRDPFADKLILQRRVFAMLGIAHSDQELVDHLLLHRLFQATPDGAAIRRLRAWTRRLIHWNRQAGFADAAAFEATLRGYWDQLFYILPDHDAGAARAHLFGWWPWRAHHAVYAAKHALSGLLRRH